MTTLREAAQQALEALELEMDTRRCKAAITALRAALAEPVQEPRACEPQYANDDGWCDWVCPKPRGYLMQCCDCELIHEVESRVAKYQPQPSEEFEVVDDPDLQLQWRMKRRDDISPQRKPMSLTDLQEALVFTNLIDRDAIDDPDNYDDGSTLAQIDELHRIIERAHGIGENT